MRTASRIVAIAAWLVLAVSFGTADDGRRATSQPAPARRPNVLLAIADDWSFPHAGVYGDPVVRTPAFDRIAREGARFTHAFAAAPSCTASRAALLTGQAIHRLAEGGNLHGFLPRTHPASRARAGGRGGSSRAGARGTRRARGLPASTSSCSAGTRPGPSCSGSAARIRIGRMKKDPVPHRASTSRRFVFLRFYPIHPKFAAIWRITFSKCSASIASSARWSNACERSGSSTTRSSW